MRSLTVVVREIGIFDKRADHLGTNAFLQFFSEIAAG